MNKTTLILFLALGLLLVPTGIALKAFSLDKYERAAREGGVATCAVVVHMDKNAPNAIPDNKPTPAPTQTTCDKCNGTKTMMSPDGITRIPCPCGANCQCKQKTRMTEAPKTKKIVLITAPSWCAPCKLVDEYTLPALEDRGWKVNKETYDNGHIHVIDYDNNPELVEKYNANNGIPTWILLENDKEMARWSGFLNGYGVKRLWDKETILTTDVAVLPWKKATK